MLNLQDVPSLLSSGLIADLDIEKYHSGPGVSKSLLDALAKSPAHYRAALMAEKKEPTPAQRLGTLIHTAIIEPEKLKVIVGPDLNKNTNAWKAFVADAAAQGLEVISKEDDAMLKGIAASVAAHPAASWALGPGYAEHSAYWTDPRTGLLCRCRPDKIRRTEKGVILVDLKSTEDASEYEFSRSIENFRYHVQAAFYTDGIENVIGERVAAFVFVAVEKKPPYAVACYQLADVDVAEGRDQYMTELDLLARCQEANAWPGYSTRIEPITRPSWARLR